MFMVDLNVVFCDFNVQVWNAVAMVLLYQGSDGKSVHDMFSTYDTRRLSIVPVPVK